MARFYSITLRGSSHQIQVINTFWYRQDALAMATNEDLAAVRTAWLLANEQDWLNMHTSGYVLQDVITQGYSDDYDRHPYLPEIHTRNVAGLDLTASMPPIVAAILSARVEPVWPARRHGLNEPARYTSVRRGYWAISPINENMVDAGGQFGGYPTAPGIWATFRDRMAANLVVPAWTVPGVPVVVSQPPPKVKERGYGIIRQCAWAQAISTRRSRKLGKGA